MFVRGSTDSQLRFSAVVKAFHCLAFWRFRNL